MNLTIMKLICFIFRLSTGQKKGNIKFSSIYIHFFLKSLLKGMCIYIYLTTGKKRAEKGNLGQSLNVCNVILHIQILQNPCTT